MKVPVACWVNSFGEDCSSKIFASFKGMDEETRIVVYDWRRCDFIVIEQDEFVSVQSEEIVP